jgi:hypothetical protein
MQTELKLAPIPTPGARPRRTRRRAVLGTAALLLAVAAPTAYAALDADTAQAAAPTRGEPYIETQLFFGTARPDGGPAVSDTRFNRFVDREITPDFPEGLTVLSGRGQWRDAHGVIEKERSYELILLYPEDRAAEKDRLIEEIRRAYEKTFGQESVGRVDDRTRVDF